MKKWWKQVTGMGAPSPIREHVVAALSAAGYREQLPGRFYGRKPGRQRVRALVFMDAVKLEEEVKKGVWEGDDAIEFSRLSYDKELGQLVGMELPELLLPEAVGAMRKTSQKVEGGVL